MRNKRTKGKIMSLVMAVAMSISVLGGATTSTLQVKAATIVSNPRIADDGTVTWDKITFGSYPQDIEEFISEPIKWRILDIDSEGNAFLLADEELDCKPYNEQGVEKNDDDGNAYTDYSCTWETCTLRDWLNGTDTYASDENAFIKAAFSEEEREAIIETTLVNEDNPRYNTEGGNNTTDKIYLLSIMEASKASYGFIGNFDSLYNRAARKTKATDYSYIHGAFRSNSYDLDGYGYWWLRSSGCDSNRAANVSCDGWSDDGGTVVEYASYAVRPVLHVNLSSPYVSDAGSVTSEEYVTAGTNRSSGDYKTPSTTNGVTTWDCVYFGNYKQNAKYEKKPIEWRVLSVNGNDAFVVADKALDCKEYNKRKEKNGYPDYSCTWETSTLRDWLNGTDDYANDDTAFINAAFVDDERNAIIETNVVNEDNLSNNAESGKNTIDKIFLLSIGEVNDTSYGFDEFNNFYTETRATKATDYAYINGAYQSNISNYDSNNMSGNCIWWLRSPIIDSNYYAARVHITGWTHDYDDPVNYGDFTSVRPALHVNLNSPYVKAVGMVSSESGLTAEYRKEKEKANDVIKLIDSIGTVTKDSKAAIEFARSAYDALSVTAKYRVENYSVLQAAESEYAEIIDNIEVPKVVALISAIGDVTNDSKTAIDSARSAYDALSETGKAKVTNYSVLQAAESEYAEIIENIEASKVITLISAIGTVTKDSKTAIESARSAYDALSETAKAKVTKYSVLQAAEAKYAELTKESSNNGNDNVGENNGNTSVTTDGNTDNTSGGSTGSNTGTTPATTEEPATTETVNTPTITETPKDALTTFNIKNKKTYKKSQKVIIKDKDGIKSVILNTKKIKVKKGKKTVSFKLSSYKKSLKKKNKWNKIIVIDVNGNKKTIQFKTK